MLISSKSKNFWMRRVGSLLSLRVFIFSLFLLLSGLAAPGLVEAGEVEERAEAATELFEESVSEVRAVTRESRPQLRRDSCYIRGVRTASNRLPSQGRGRIRVCETAPLPLRC